MVEALKNAVRYAKVPNFRRQLSALGEGWVAEEALAIAVLSVLATTSAEAAIVAAVNHGGDSDSTGAIAGNLAGTLYGSRELPAEWTTKVELFDVIQQLAEDLTQVVTFTEDVEELAVRYPPV